jgi:hypothetical protein
MLSDVHLKSLMIYQGRDTISCKSPHKIMGDVGTDGDLQVASIRGYITPAMTKSNICSFQASTVHKRYNGEIRIRTDV